MAAIDEERGGFYDSPLFVHCDDDDDDGPRRPTAKDKSATRTQLKWERAADLLSP